MGIVTTFLDTAEAQLVATQASQFGLTAGALGGVLQVACVLAIILVFINGLIQFRPVPVGDAVIVVIKLILISQFATVWEQFSVVLTAVRTGMDTLAGQMLSQNAGGGTSLTAAFDSMFENLGTAANTTLDALSAFSRGIMSGIFFVLSGLVAALVSLVMIFALIMVTLHVAVAPLFIGLSIFSATKDYFYKWLQSTVTYLLYPVVIAAVLGSMMRLTQGVVDNLNPENLGTIAALVPFIVVLMMMSLTILLIPMIVSGLSGAISAAGPLAAAAVASSMQRNIAGAARAGGTVAKGAGAVAGKAKEMGSLAAAGARERTSQALNWQMNMADRYRK